MIGSFLGVKGQGAKINVTDLGHPEYLQLALPPPIPQIAQMYTKHMQEKAPT